MQFVKVFLCTCGVTAYQGSNFLILSKNFEYRLIKSMNKQLKNIPVSNQPERLLSSCASVTWSVPKWWVSSLSFMFSEKMAGDTFLLESSRCFRSLMLDTSLSRAEPEEDTEPSTRMRWRGYQNKEEQRRSSKKLMKKRGNREKTKEEKNERWEKRRGEKTKSVEDERVEIEE